LARGRKKLRIRVGKGTRSSYLQQLTDLHEIAMQGKLEYWGERAVPLT